MTLFRNPSPNQRQAYPQVLEGFRRPQALERLPVQSKHTYIQLALRTVIISAYLRLLQVNRDAQPRAELRYHIKVALHHFCTPGRTSEIIDKEEVRVLRAVLACETQALVVKQPR